MADRYVAKTEADFPTSLPPYGVWWMGSHLFTTHNTLTAVKNAVTANATNNWEQSNRWGYRAAQGDGKVRFNQDVKVYELHNNQWHLIYEMTKDAERKDHELWKGAAPKGPQTVTEDEVDAAIQSIILGQG